MLTNYLKIIVRNLFRSPLYFFLNVFGLSVGVAACSLLIHYATFESNYDAFISNVDNKYRILVKDNEGTSAHVPIPVHSLMKEEFSQIKNSVAVRLAVGVMRSTPRDKESVFDDETNIVSATEDFFEIFDVEFIHGKKEQLNEPGKLFISEAIAIKYFGLTDVVGESMIFFESNFGEVDLTIQGVYKNPRADTHFPVHGVFAMKNLEGSTNPWAKVDNWGWGEFYTYIELQDGAKLTQQERNDFIDKYIGKENRERAGLEARLQPVTQIHTTAGILDEMTPSRDRQIIDFLKIIGVFIVFLASINYVNLSTARGLKRAKEVGIRKNMGANRMTLVTQFAFESLLVNFLSLILAFTIIQLVQPLMNAGIGGAFNTSPWSNSTALIWISIAIVVSVAWSSLQPALVISSFDMVKILKGDLTNFGKGKTYRKLSVVVQFTVSLLLMISSYVLYNQVDYFQEKEIGIDINNKLIISRPKETVDNYTLKAESFKNDLLKLSQVKAVSMSGNVPSFGFNWSTNNMHRADLGPNGPGEFGVNVTYIDNSYVKVYKPKLLAGSGISELSKDYKNVRVLINKKALVPLKIETAVEAIGMQLIQGDMNLEIVGVIEDYQHTSIQMESRPAAFIFQQNAQKFTIDYHQGDHTNTSESDLVSSVQELYNIHFGGTNFNYTFLDVQFSESYEFEVFFSKIMAVFTALAILLAVLGMFGLSLYNLERKTKEVGIRKSLGASAYSLFFTNVKPFMIILLISTLIALPTAYYLGQSWLEDYTYKISLDLYLFALPILLLMVVTLITVSYHVIKLNKTNPVDSLRYE